jgi:sulfite reductase (NADPH) hemoprotein beta-component
MIQTEQAAKLSRNEGLKAASPMLAGTISQALADSSDHFSDEDYEFLKFHGVYQQDDRDKRKTGKAYSLMVRTRFPGGVLTGKQYVACDDISNQYGNGTMRITTRQDFQLHGILKSNARATIGGLNRALMTTIAACGDVARNVLAPPTPATSPLVDEVIEQAKALSAVLTPQTSAYHSIWVEGQEVKTDTEAARSFVDPLYGATYLPRKFKAAFVIPPLNDVDVYANDIGFVVIIENGKIAGYNLVAGGGLGMSHGNAQTFPRLADLIGFLTPEQLEAVAKAVLTVHRDFGDRTNRKHARLKYVLAEKGVEWFRAEVEQRAGMKFQPARPFKFERQGDVLGWHEQSNGKWFLGLFIENGRVKDAGDYQLKTALRRVIEKFEPEVRLTASQNLLLVNVAGEARAEIDALLAEHGVSAKNPYSRTRLASMACPALPTCGLALAESERTLPDILTRVEALLGELGLPEEEIVIRMTGCPNGCARPYLAEVAFVGRAPNKYQLYLGGNEASTRLNRLYKDGVKGEELVPELKTLLTRYIAKKQPGERFGDFCDRTVFTAPAVPELAPS